MLNIGKKTKILLVGGVILSIFSIFFLYPIVFGEGVKCEPYDKSMTGYENELRVEACEAEIERLGREHDKTTADLKSQADTIRSRLYTEETGLYQEAKATERQVVKLSGQVGHRED